MQPKQMTIPDHTAVRVALWRALHVELDSKPYVFEDEVGLKLLDLDESWKQRPDMNPDWTRGYRAAIVARARFIEDSLIEKSQQGINQYVILGAGLDSFAQRRSDMADKVKVFEIDEPQTQSWKRQRLMDLKLGIPDFLKLVPVDFESGESWLEKLQVSGFDKNKPAFLSSTGVAMYLTREANLDSLKKIATLAPGSTLAMTFMLPTDMVAAEERAQYEMVQDRARASGTPFLSLFRPSEILDLAREAGFKNLKHISREDLIKRYFTGRSDGLLPATGEEFLLAERE
jgi:methyltransferase (TIGR00027 family)